MMRAEGKEYTKENNCVKWFKGTGENTGLPDHCVDWVTMASSFHWTDPQRSLPEFSRILKKPGFLSILWNTRDVTSSELHTKIEELIYKIVPGVKRISSGNAHHTQDWSAVLTATKNFKDVHFIETSYTERMTPERYIGAWRSVNDIQSQAGPENFKKILQEITTIVSSFEYIDVPYKMRSWTTQKV
jgi:ubiquinone/menaquinone biosynthesis C-methylase UbiE